jgi:tripartite-type tricarboxylate transporter receptor subunit TctC
VRLPRRVVVRAGLALAAGVIPWRARAEAYPSRPIQLVTPTAPGGGTDFVARLIGDALATALKQPVLTINKPGASGIIAADAVARSPADGYTLLVTANTHVVAPALFKKLPYDTVRDFTAVSTIGRSPLVLVASPATGVRSLRDLVELAKRQPEAMTFATADGSTRVAGARLGLALGFEPTAVNYKGTGPAVTDVAGGHVNFSVTTIASTLPFKASGTVNLVALLAESRSALLPDVATTAEAGHPGLESTGWWGLLGPPGLPREVTARLADIVRETLARPLVKKRLAVLSIEPWSSTPEAFDAFIRSEVTLNRDIAKRAGIEPE